MSLFRSRLFVISGHRLRSIRLPAYVSRSLPVASQLRSSVGGGSPRGHRLGPGGAAKSDSPAARTRFSGGLLPGGARIDPPGRRGGGGSAIAPCVTGGLPLAPRVRFTFACLNWSAAKGVGIE
ncbi:hypothetical protein SprV_0301049400 [Sparganum proliferum]